MTEKEMREVDENAAQTVRELEIQFGRLLALTICRDNPAAHNGLMKYYPRGLIELNPE